MKAKVKIEQEVNIETVIIDIECRYVGYGDDDDLPSDFPLLVNGNRWVAHVNIDTGKIAGWPSVGARKMFTKVCDAGIYKLVTATGAILATIVGYVPHGVVPGEFGDYVDLRIDETGTITNWPERPDISAFFRDDD
jgi:hypothetical protein